MQYLSPSGQSDRFREWMIKDREFLVKYFQNRSELELMRLEHKRQRSLINPRLRYDVMKRDNFRCVLCGRGAADGVKLHVDHLLPIAKGGKTEPDNLRTLCADCNLGKSDRYDPDGLN
ncbi:MAG: HNH endonuclease [Parasporobacterium sp.]|nr:HNH endonuclease [Parasporobacterium sp.]